MNRLLNRYDPDLSAKRLKGGALGVFRTQRMFDLYRWEGVHLWIARDIEDLVFMCTDNWIETGTPVDWGLEPIYWQLQKLDGWRDDTDYDRFCEDREKAKSNKLRAFRNDIRARAYDLRKDFAKATNDINTSTVEKTFKKERDKKWLS